MSLQRDRIEDLLKKHAPARLASLDALMHENKGTEHRLLAKLRQEYEPVVETPAFKKRQESISFDFYEVAIKAAFVGFFAWVYWFFFVTQRIAPDVENVTAPPYRVRFDVTTPSRPGVNATHGSFTMEVHPEWAPMAARRFTELLMDDWYGSDHMRLYHVIDPAMPEEKGNNNIVEFGIHPDSEYNRNYRWDYFKDELVRFSNVRGMVAMTQHNHHHSRSSIVMINRGNNRKLDSERVAPFAKIVSGMEYLDECYGGYGSKVDRSQVEREGNKYLKLYHPGLSYITKTTVLDDPGTWQLIEMATPEDEWEREDDE